jgi:hypothetical protein
MTVQSARKFHVALMPFVGALILIILWLFVSKGPAPAKLAEIKGTH